MAGTKWDNQDVRHITEGHSAKVMAARATYNQHDSARPAFIRVVILDVISDPTIVDDTKLQYYQTLNVSNATPLHHVTASSLDVSSATTPARQSRPWCSSRCFHHTLHYLPNQVSMSGRCSRTLTLRPASGTGSVG